MNKMPTETNRDELDKCIFMADKKISIGDFKTAERLTRKAKKMDPMDQDNRIKELWSKILVATNRREVITNLPQIAEVKKQTRAEYSQQQIEAVRSVQCVDDSDYHEILGLKHGASKKDIERAARKLRALLSPDVNRAPGAENAFMKVGRAKDKLLEKLED